MKKKDYLKKLSDNQVSLIKSIHKQTNDIDRLVKIMQGQKRMHPGLENTGEFTIGYLKDDTVFMLLHKWQIDVLKPYPLSVGSENGEPIKFASMKNRGFLIGKDYDGHEVLAYCDYIPNLGWGTVTQIDFSEIRKPFYTVSLYVLIALFILVFAGIYLFKRFSDPIIKRIIESEEKYRLLFEFIPLGITLSDRSGKIIESNTESEAILNIDKNEQNKRKVDSQEWKIVRPDSSEMPASEFAGSISLKENRKVDNVEMGIVKSGGDISWLSVSAAPFPIKDFGIITVYNDISRRVEAERTLKQNEELLKKHSEELKALNDTKDKFFRIIAHDLKNPFGSLLGASEYLFSNVEKYDREKIKKLSKILFDSAKSGYDILSNLLEWSRSQTGNLAFSPSLHNLAEIVQVNLNVVSTAAFSKGITLTSVVPPDLEVFADRNMLNTILRNLLINAVKFTHQEGSVTIEAEKTDKIVTIRVIDTGTGIPEEDIDKLFRIDVKYVNLGTENEKGTGLGLILCREFIEKHCGTIDVSSTLGKGTEFTISLPFQI